MILPLTGDIEITELTQTMCAAVPTVTGLVNQGTTLLVRHDHGLEFSPTEQAQLQTILLAHDPVAIRAQREAHRSAMAAAKRQDPTHLSVPDRLARLELIVGG